MGKKVPKARALYGILQEGGMEKHTVISAGDKDLQPTFDKFCQFASRDIIKAAHQHGAMGDVYTEEELE